MKISTKLKALCCFMMVSFSGISTASTIQCHGCSDDEMWAYANENIFQLRANGPMYMTDSQRRIVKKFAFFTDQTEDYDPEYDALNIWVDEMEVEPEIFNAVSTFYTRVEQAMGSTEVVVPDIPGFFPEDAHDALIDSAEMGRLLDHVEDSYPGVVNSIVDYLRQYETFWFKPENVKPPIKLKFPDGSSQILVYDRETQTWKTAPNTSRDSRGNLIPEKKEDVTSGPVEYTFYDVTGNEESRDNFNDMIRRIEDMDVLVINVGNPGPRGSRYVMSCTPEGCLVSWVVY